ncbi:MAG: hypothetical protein BYD32DRAFT_463682 [Podila humilis]|nr:MAG: hypothetical protein BYD32DRAFT_463682 [Podila humilis]
MLRSCAALARIQIDPDHSLAALVWVPLSLLSLEPVFAQPPFSQYASHYIDQFLGHLEENASGLSTLRLGLRHVLSMAPFAYAGMQSSFDSSGDHDQSQPEHEEDEQEEEEARKNLTEATHDRSFLHIRAWIVDLTANLASGFYGEFVPKRFSPFLQLSLDPVNNHSCESPQPVGNFDASKSPK